MIAGELGTASDELTQALLREGYGIQHTRNGEEAVVNLRETAPTLILVSTKIEGTGIFDFLRNLKTVSSSTQYPIIVLTEEVSTSELVKAFKEGAHDYVDLLRPPEELLARIRNLTGLFYSNASRAESLLEFEDVRVQVRSRKVFRGDDPIKLTPKEYDLLCFMLRRVNHVCSREELLQEVWGYDFRIDTNVVDVYIRHLRKKIDRGYARKLIHTVRGTGYMIY